MRRHARACLAALLLGGPVPLAHRAEAAASGPVHVVLSYAAYVHGFRAMVLTVDVGLRGDAYTVGLQDHTVGLVGAMIDNHVVSRATGRFVDAAAIPTRYDSTGHSRGADRTTAIDYPDGNPAVRVLTPVEPARDVVAPAETRGAIDPLSAIASLFRDVASSEGCGARLRIYDGARLTDVQVWDAGATTIETNDASPYAGRVTECDFRSREIAGFLHDANYARSHNPQGGRAWLAPIGTGGLELPVRARFSTVDHGEITLFLTGFSDG